MEKKSQSVVPAKLFVDSSAWLAFFSARDGHHVEADRLVRKAFSQRIFVFTSNLVVAEVHRLLLFRAGIEPAATAIERIHSSPNVTVKYAVAKTHQEAILWLSKLNDQVITYTDVISFAIMQENQCTVALSFDKDFILAGYSHWRGEDLP